jgi:D-arabinose 1-dehydrogenase-like Zn-dependent alcohol dehydrogenase
MKALVVPARGSQIGLQTVPVPEALPGSVIVKVLSTFVNPNQAKILRSKDSKDSIGFTFPTPMIPGAYSVGRIADVGPDTTSLAVDQLVLLEPFIRGRDNGDVQILWGGYDGPSQMSKKLMADSWRNGAYAQYVRAPLENTWALNEKRLCGSPIEGGLGLKIPELVHIAICAVVYGGMRSIDLKAGETIIIAPATGLFSGSAIAVATAMGASVIAVSRNLEGLKKVQSIFPRVKIVQTSGEPEKDTAAIKTYGPADAFMDISPPAATNSPHLGSCMMALKQYGRISLMGGRGDSTIPLSYRMAVFMNLTIRGQFMYERADVKGVIKLAESGLLKIGKEAGLLLAGEFSLEEYEKAFDAAEASVGSLACMHP